MIFRALYVKCMAMVCVAITCALLLVHCGFCSQSKTMIPMNIVDNLRNKHEIADVVAIFPRTVEEINEMGVHYIQAARKNVDAVIAVPAHERTFANTVAALDTIAISDLYLAGSFGWLLDVASPQESIRKAANELRSKIRNFYTEYIGGNRQLYDAFKVYADGNAHHEKLTPAQRYCLDETIKSWERLYYVHLPVDKREQAIKLKKESEELEALFKRNVAADKKTITVDVAGLAGLDQAFIDALKKTDNGLYILDDSTYFKVMNYCQVEDTRRRLYQASLNRAYPVNEQVLKDIVIKQNELAHVLGFASYADLYFSNQMEQTAERAEHFIMDLVEQSAKKEKEEFALWLAHKPESVTLTADGKIKPWDVAYLQNHYKIHNFSVDEQKIAEYFPAEATIEKLFDIYGQFFSINFQQVPVTGLWHDSVKAVAVFNKDRTQLLGYLFLDLFLRPDKDSGSYRIRVIPAALDENNHYIVPVISALIANFSPATDGKPSLLNHDDVRTFVRLLGYAIHEILGATHLPSFSGASLVIKPDFRFLPSRTLEEWLWDGDILRLVSGHYLTGDSLPQTMINTMIACKQYNIGYRVIRDGFSALFFVNLFKEGAQKDLQRMHFDLRTQLSPDLLYDVESHPYASSQHNPYDYEYLWSKVFALDLFEEIKKHGLLDPVIGQRYVREVIGKGGSQDPNELLRNFLQREPNNKAFLKSMGL